MCTDYDQNLKKIVELKIIFVKKKQENYSKLDLIANVEMSKIKIFPSDAAAQTKH